MAPMTSREVRDSAPPEARCDADAARRRAEIRAFVRAHHPDRGGDPHAFAEGLRALRGSSATGSSTGAASRPTAYRRRTVPEHLVGWMADRGRGWCGAARRRWPGLGERWPGLGERWPGLGEQWAHRLGVRWVHRRDAPRAQRGSRVR
ncbi:hypothetical protein FraQA3DRAFT_5387 [Frankia sp. QA3]|nr:hypothetical protein FraQA3DRAFT_5387 [Frankia sp. QA3]